MGNVIQSVSRIAPSVDDSTVASSKIKAQAQSSSQIYEVLYMLE